MRVQRHGSSLHSKRYAAHGCLALIIITGVAKAMKWLRRTR